VLLRSGRQPRRGAGYKPGISIPGGFAAFNARHPVHVIVVGRFHTDGRNKKPPQPGGTKAVRVSFWTEEIADIR